MECSKCGKSYTKNAYYLQHINSCNIIECKFCNKKMSTKQALDRHMQTVHPNTSSEKQLASLKKEMADIKKSYEKKIKEMESSITDKNSEINDLKNQVSKCHVDTVDLFKSYMNRSNNNILIQNNQNIKNQLVVINDIPNISNKDLKQDIDKFVETWDMNKFLITNKTFVNVATEFKSMQNQKITDASRYNSVFYDEDQNKLVKDRQMISAIGKLIDAIPEDLIDSFESFALQKESDIDYFKQSIDSKLFIKNCLRNKEVNEIKQIGKKFFQIIDTKLRLLIDNENDMNDNLETLIIHLVNLFKVNISNVLFKNINNFTVWLLTMLKDEPFKDFIRIHNTSHVQSEESNGPDITINNTIKISSDDFLFNVKKALNIVVNKENSMDLVHFLLFDLLEKDNEVKNEVLETNETFKDNYIRKINWISNEQNYIEDDKIFKELLWFNI